MTVDAYAKINLILNVLGKRCDGYHEIETVFYALELCDRVQLDPIPAGEGRSRVGIGRSGKYCPDIPQESNIAYKALMLMKESFGRGEEYLVTIEKNIPSPGGLGGGSADAAAVITGLAKLWGLPVDERLYGIAARLGSDVPFCLASQNGHRAAIGRGRGEILEFVELPEPDIELVFRDCSMEEKSKTVYSELKKEDYAQPFDIEALVNSKDPAEMAKHMGNHLQAPYERLCGRKEKDLILCGAGPTYFRVNI